jgi:hypothetical protein
MTTRIDPKPGRWILPLVVLGMVAFTYLFVRQLPGAGATASTSTTVASGESTSTTGGPEETTTTVPLAPEVRAYLDTIVRLEATLTGLQTELAAANSGFDGSPRTVEYDDAVTRFEAVAAQTLQLVSDINAVTAPAELASIHTALISAATDAASAAEGALAGLKAPPPDTGDDRRGQVAAFDRAVEGFSQEVVNATAFASG